MTRFHPLVMILVGFLLMVMGLVLSYLMLPSVHVIVASFPLIFLTYTAQITGLFLGLIGAASYVRLKRK